MTKITRCSVNRQVKSKCWRVNTCNSPQSTVLFTCLLTLETGPSTTKSRDSE